MSDSTRKAYHAAMTRHLLQANTSHHMRKGNKRKRKSQAGGARKISRPTQQLDLRV